MRNLIAGIAIGLAVGIVGTLGVQRVRQRPEQADANRTTLLFEAVPVVMERALPGVRVLDVALHTPSIHSVGYEHEALYDANIKYQLSGRIKHVILPFGFAKGTLIFPNTTDVVIADDKAEVIATLESDGSQKSVQPNNEMQRTRPAQAKEPRR